MKRNEKLINRMKEVIEISKKVYESYQLDPEYDRYAGIYLKNEYLLQQLLTKCRNVINIVYGKNSIQYNELDSIIMNGFAYSDNVEILEGFLVAALDDYRDGFTIGQEFLIAGEIFDSVMEESKHLLDTDHKDAAAVLGRVVIEDSLRRIARREGIDDSGKISRVNDELKKEQIYLQPQWRIIQGWLDIGNSAAHGKFEEYTKEQVVNMLNGIEQFIAIHLVN